jgi:hypothetical protein
VTASAAVSTSWNEARDGAAALREVTDRRFEQTLAALHEAWRPDGRARRSFLDSSPPLGLSPAMIEWGLDRFALRLDPDVAARRAALQLGAAHGARLRAEPLGVLLYVVSGNVFTGPAEALLAGLLTRNAAIVKRPSTGGAFVDAFLASLAEAAPQIASAVRVLGWRGGTESIERPLAAAVDGIVIAADADTVAAYRRLAPPATALIELGPRISVAVITRGGTFDADGLALDVAGWDQLACSAAQSVHVEGEERALSVAADLAASLERLASRLPEGETELNERIEVARFRHESAFAESQGAARLFPAAARLATVVFERDPEVRASPLRRCVRVKPFHGVEGLTRALRPARRLLHTAGLAVAHDEAATYEACLAAAGARRLCRIGRMNEPRPDGAHDGMFELQRLVRWVECDT